MEFHALLGLIARIHKSIYFFLDFLPFNPDARTGRKIVDKCDDAFK